jgi:motility quorum-sensing regulator / GCU-specific mRNA interferase toxin
VEKRKPHYDLASIKTTFRTVEALRMTKTAHDCALALGLLLQDVVDLIREMTREQFYKSMTSMANVAL